MIANITVEQLPDGDAGIFRTVDRMLEIIRTESVTFFVRQCAEAIIRGVDERDSMGEVRAVYTFVKENIRYTGDMLEMEFIQTPTYMLNKIIAGETVMGDCDDYVVLMLSLLRSLGFMVRVKITGYMPENDFSHVYGEVFIYKDWVPIDGIIRGFAVGDEAANPSRIKTYEV